MHRYDAPTDLSGSVRFGHVSATPCSFYGRKDLRKSNVLSTKEEHNMSRIRPSIIRPLAVAVSRMSDVSKREHLSDQEALDVTCLSYYFHSIQVPVDEDFAKSPFIPGWEPRM
ncbi:hypothetical protein ANO14919_003420 [Xylariales sp. No.14919]|nr:hypothetical protein ANO14919_003420 [Xylariales sp. No.14919]